MAARKTTKVYVLAQPAPDSAGPSVWIDRLKDGSVTFGVKVSARSVAKARELAMEQFDALRGYAEELDGTETERKLRASTELMNKLRLEVRAEAAAEMKGMPDGASPCPCGGNHLAFAHYTTSAAMVAGRAANAGGGAANGT